MVRDLGERRGGWGWGYVYDCDFDCGGCWGCGRGGRVKFESSGGVWWGRVGVICWVFFLVFMVVDLLGGYLVLLRIFCIGVIVFIEVGK